MVWNTLTWVDEKGETVFDPSATGDAAKEIDRLERELLLRGIVMCPRATAPTGETPVVPVGETPVVPECADWMAAVTITARYVTYLNM